MLNGKHLRNIRTARGWTQERLAAALGVNMQDISRLERSARGVTRWQAYAYLCLLSGQALDIGQEGGTRKAYARHFKIACTSPDIES